MTTENPSPVHVFWNRARRVWSIRSGRLVVDRRPSLALAGCVMRASEAGRLRCQAAARREVVATIVGTLSDGARPADAIRIGYRPTEPGFRRRDTDEIVTSADAVWFEPDGTAWALAPTPSPETHQ
ncbi:MULTISPECIES: hypothetical protein [Methylobacteriaceae]|uniref:Uncharacterized protein n=1 Tax=Methylorubrum thiocyanatum TaxID=47958 RepID=A0AA40VC85_9HYPH|nr:hypothetical protein [Methylorubrum thiocyanatum]AWI88456.1 hypothetical protein C0214_09470 [Methylobacterium sp. DM1]MBA8915059.1 hypothetical protein [Methylorubrum thiocyanatum]GJE79465.1 hypothetical protein CJNNKLLH_0791 [Methylorubrum thiocyanatum]